MVRLPQTCTVPVLCTTLLWFVVHCDYDTTSTTKPTLEISSKEDIQAYFVLKRKQHLEAIQTVVKFPRYEQKYEMLKRIYEKLVEIIDTTRVKVENSDYELGGELPKGETMEYVLQVLDNCAFFGNLLLKLPDLSNRLLKINNQWIDSYKWCFTFATSSNLIDDYSLKMFNLAAQGLQILPRSDDYNNFYESKSQKQKQKSSSESTILSRGIKSPFKQKVLSIKKPKGPRMSKSEL